MADQDVLGPFQEFAPGLVLQRVILDALESQYAANGGVLPTEVQVRAIVGPLPAPPVSLTRMDFSNPPPRDG